MEKLNIIEAFIEGCTEKFNSIIDRFRSKKIDWITVFNNFKKRGKQNCPICLELIDSQDPARYCLLDCSHAIHVFCLKGYERFMVSSFKCPVCRTKYKQCALNNESVIS